MDDTSYSLPKYQVEEYNDSIEEITEEDELPSPNEIRKTANHHFSQADYDTALPLYELAVSITKKQNPKDESLVLHLCNYSACLYKMDFFEESCNVAAEAVDVSKGLNAKAYFRLARSQIALRKYNASMSTIDLALKTLPKDTTEESQIEDLKKLKLLARKKKMEPQGAKKDSILNYKLFQDDVLGEGNFSRIVLCKRKHEVDDESSPTYAIKIISKKKAADLAKRQHPNVYNEIAMEKRILKDRLPPQRHIIPFISTFEDYNNVYFVMEHMTHGDLWSRLFFEKKMVGCCFNLIPNYVRQLLSAVEHCHKNGIVHRDIKTENILINENEKLVLIDYGTAKDLIETDLNGPEFVGTPDFMTPEAVKGKAEPGVSFEGDLWAYGCVLFQMYMGFPPFESSSSYLAFLRIQDGFVKEGIPWGMSFEKEGWELIRGLMKVNAMDRLGAGSFKLEGKKVVGDYGTLWNHSYFSRHKDTTSKVPSLRDLCQRACVTLLQSESYHLNLISSEFEPGDGSSKDFLKLHPNDKERVMYLADKCGILSQPRILRLFSNNKIQARLEKVHNHEYVGLSWGVDHKEVLALMNPPQGQESSWDDVELVLFSHELFFEEKEDKKGLTAVKNTLKQINRQRPKAVLCTGNASQSILKLLAKINESINVIMNMKKDFFTFWIRGSQFIVLNNLPFSQEDDTSEERNWFYQEMILTNTSRHLTFVFVAGDVKALPKYLLQKMAYGKVTAVIGSSSSSGYMKEEYVYDISDLPEKESKKVAQDDNDEDDDEFEAKDLQEHTMLLVNVGGVRENGDCDAKKIILQEENQWKIVDY